MTSGMFGRISMASTGHDGYSLSSFMKCTQYANRELRGGFGFAAIEMSSLGGDQIAR